jgi:hypothetical protein
MGKNESLTRRRNVQTQITVAACLCSCVCSSGVLMSKLGARWQLNAVSVHRAAAALCCYTAGSNIGQKFYYICVVFAFMV